MSRVHIVLEEIADLRRTIAEQKKNTEQSASQISKGKSLKITAEVLGLPLLPTCGNCGSQDIPRCTLHINYSTKYNPTILRDFYSCNQFGILRDPLTKISNGYPSNSPTPVSINLAPGDAIIVNSAYFQCQRRFTHKNRTFPLQEIGVSQPYNFKYHSDIKEFIQEKFDRLCSEPELQASADFDLRAQVAALSVRMEALWPKAGWVHAGTEGEWVKVPPGTRLRYGSHGGHWVENIMADGNSFHISTDVLSKGNDPAPGITKTLQRWSESIVPPWKTPTCCGSL